MRKVLTFIMSITLLINISNVGRVEAMTWEEQQRIFNEFLQTRPITVCINGDYVDFGEVQPQMIKERNMVPLRALFEAMGAVVTFDDANRKVSVKRDDIHLSFMLEDTIIHKTDSNGTKDLVCDVPFTVMNGSVYAPVRFACEALGGYVSWDNNNRRVMILDKWSFKNSIKADAPAFYDFLDMPIFKLADSSVNHNQQVTFLLKGIDKENMDSQYDVTMSEYIHIKDGKIKANIECDLEINGLFDFYSYISAIFKVDTKKLKDVKFDILMDDKAIYVKTNVLKAFEVSPINKDRAENIWIKFKTPEGNPLVYMINDETKSLFDLLSAAIFPAEGEYDQHYYGFKSKVENVKYILTLIKNSVNDNYFKFDKNDNANFSIGWNPSTDSIRNAFKQYKEWQKPFQFSNSRDFYYDYKTKAFNFDKKPNMSLTESEVKSISDYTHQINIAFSVKDSTISLFDMHYDLLRENYNDGWNVTFKFEANSIDEPKKAVEPIVMPDNKHVIDYDTIGKLIFFPYTDINYNLLQTVDQYNYSSEN
ncbi:MAG: copper amine oxidase N-terminal domain-containing protein [Hyphomonadaceae bacterium]|nr:copper amine oxidase N-terminal domain-containing protein [Clostridia bacterium]